VQERTFLHFARELTFLWDYALADRRDSGFRDHRSVTYLDQQARLKDGRAGDPEGLGRVPYDMARECLQRLDLGYRAGFRRYREGKGRPGFPRFRSETSSFTYIPASRLCTLAPGARPRLHVPKVGEGEVRRHRDPPLRGIPKNVTIRNESRGRWFAILQYEIPDPPPPPPGDPVAPVGVDVGLHHLAVLSTGEVVDPPRFRVRSEQRLRVEQRRLSRKRKGSRRYARQRERLARCHARVRNQRKDHLHRLTSHWAARHDLIAFENTDLAEFREANRRAKGMADAGWGMLRSMARYKMPLRSGRYVEVEARGTTQTCSTSGRVADPPLTLSDRVYRCPCGLEMDRDRNAARNILERGWTEVRRSSAELTRVEAAPPPTRVSGRRAYLRKREPRPGGIPTPTPFRVRIGETVPGTRAATILPYSLPWVGISFVRLSPKGGRLYRQLVESCWDRKAKRSRTLVLQHRGPVSPRFPRADSGLLPRSSPVAPIHFDLDLLEGRGLALLRDGGDLALTQSSFSRLSTEFLLLWRMLCEEGLAEHVAELVPLVVQIDCTVTRGAAATCAPATPSPA
ncbi:MAG: RNA-guided endonuclease InsQ/TnpB family protein, partial [Thermoplasmata archaeon]